MSMGKKLIIFSMIIICCMTANISCGRAEPPAEEKKVPEVTQAPSPAVSPGETEEEMAFTSMENAYYSKYVELAEKYGTHSLYDYYRIRHVYSGRSYLSGVCVVNLMDFNKDGIQDLFVVYSNGQLDNVVDDGSNLEIYDFPNKDTYELEIWTYIDGKLSEMLHESSVSLCYTYPNEDSEIFRNNYKNFITVYEKKDGFPLIQIYDETHEYREYTNIYYSDGELVWDKLLYHHNGGTFRMNGLEITEDIWSEHVAGYNKILLYSYLADANRSSTIIDGTHNIDYNSTLEQTRGIVDYLKRVEKTDDTKSFHIAEGEYISLYLQEIERSNRLPFGPDTIEDHDYGLYDINQDGMPELILFESSIGAATHFHFYTVIDGVLTNCGDYGRSYLYSNGEGGLLAYFTRMGYYLIDKIELKEDTLLITPIAEGSVPQDPYPELEEYGYENYGYLPLSHPAMPMGVYTYGQTDD